jgi:site-specific recombinase XerC
MNTAEMITGWAASQRRRGLAVSTIDKRTRLLRRWIDRAGGDPFVDELDVVLEDWLDVLDLAPNGRYSTISHLHQFYRWAIRQGLAVVDPTVFLDRPRVKQGLPRPIHPTDLDVALMTAAPGMRVALLLAATSGLRCCEIARLRWDDVHDGQARVLGKGSKERIVPLHSETARALDELGRASVFVLAGWQSAKPTAPGGVVSQRGNAHLHSLGISSTMHTLRHYAGTHALRGCGDLRKVQELLGHSSPATTAIYTRLDVGALASVVESIPIRAA